MKLVSDETWAARLRLEASFGVNMLTLSGETPKWRSITEVNVLKNTNKKLQMTSTGRTQPGMTWTVVWQVTDTSLSDGYEDFRPQMVLLLWGSQNLYLVCAGWKRGMQSLFWREFITKKILNTVTRQLLTSNDVLDRRWLSQRRAGKEPDRGKGIFPDIHASQKSSQWLLTREGFIVLFLKLLVKDWWRGWLNFVSGLLSQRLMNFWKATDVIINIKTRSEKVVCMTWQWHVWCCVFLPWFCSYLPHFAYFWVISFFLDSFVHRVRFDV